MRNGVFAEQVAELLISQVFELASGFLRNGEACEKQKIARFCAENIKKWGEWFPEDSQGADSKFKATLSLLRKKLKGDFPQDFEYFSALDEERGALLQIKEELMRLSAKMVASKKLY